MIFYPHDFIDYCAHIGARLTSLRKRILFILWHHQKPLKAYEILTQLQETEQNANPPSVYRVLDYLEASGIVHKIESIQSYTLCQEPKKQLASEILMVCYRCHKVSEAYDKTLIDLMQQLSEVHCFRLSQDVIELKGICGSCHL